MALRDWLGRLRGREEAPPAEPGTPEQRPPEPAPPEPPIPAPNDLAPPPATAPPAPAPPPAPPPVAAPPAAALPTAAPVPPSPAAAPPPSSPAPLAAEAPPPQPSGGGGWLSRLRGGLQRTTARLTGSVSALFRKRRLDDEALEELEETLIAADLGVAASRRIVEGFRRTRFGKEVTDEEVKAALAA